MSDQDTGGKSFKTFLAVWLGQFVSLLGSGLTRFALGVWVYQETNSVTLFAMISVFAFLPGILVAPFAGVWVDRWDRRKVMMYSDLVAGLATLAAAILFATDNLQIWHIWLIVGAGAVAETFQWPAYAAATTLLVPDKQLGRANGMIEASHSTSQILAPLLAGFLILSIGLEGVIFIDFVTFLIAVGTLLFLRFPKPEASEQGSAGGGSVLKEAANGWRFITAHKGLLALLLFFAALNFANSFTIVLTTPLVLEFANADALGTVLSVGGVGMFLGSLLMTAWGGPKQKIYGVLLFSLVLGAGLLIHGLRADVFLICVGSFIAAFCIPLVNGSSQTIWQRKVPGDLQGRVFALRRMFAWSMNPLAFVLAGPLAESVFEPMMMPDGVLANHLGPILGTGPGRGIATLFLCAGLGMILISIAGLLYGPLRRIEDEEAQTVTENTEAEPIPA